MRTVQVTLRDVRLSVEFMFHKGCEASLSGPHEPASVSVQQVMVIGSLTDIQALLDEPAMHELEELLLARQRHDDDVARDDHADYQREQQRMDGDQP